MKESKFNYYFKGVEGNIVVYNTRTSALAEFSEKDYLTMKNSLYNKKNSMNQRLKKELTYGGYIVDDDINENEVIEHNLFSARFSTKSLNLTIAPTANCNFKCPYCFERNVLRNQSMSDEIMYEVIKFVEYHIRHIEHLNITWYGGEPLLELKKIEKLSKAFIKLCNEYNVNYYSGIITNGYLLSDKTLKKLMDYKVSNIQITIDGVKEVHDSRRCLKDNRGSFDKIIENLLSFFYLKTEKNFPSIGLRMNIDKTNLSGLYELLTNLSKLKIYEIASFYIAAVYDKDDKNFLNTYSPKEFNKIESEFLLRLSDFGFLRGKYINYPIPNYTQCGCDCLNSYVIDSDGLLYKCWEEIGNHENSIGKIGSEDDELPENKNYYKYLLNNPTKDRKCENCIILPLCMGGGCPLRKFRDGYVINCEDKKRSILENVELYYRELKNAN